MKYSKFFQRDEEGVHFLKDDHSLVVRGRLCLNFGDMRGSERKCNVNATFERKGGVSMSNWHSMEVDQVLRELNTNPYQGLSGEEVRSRLEKYGYNELKREEKPQSPFWSLKNILTIILLNAAALSVLVTLLFPSIPTRLKSWLRIIVEAM